MPEVDNFYLDANGILHKSTHGDAGETFGGAQGDQFIRMCSYIDTLVHNKLKKIRITPSGVCDDNTFVRRAYLDIIGVLPTPEAVKAFVADKSPDKRSKLVDELIARPEQSPNSQW